jgi:hypothetical protein
MRRHVERKSIGSDTASEDCFRLCQDAINLRLRQHKASTQPDSAPAARFREAETWQCLEEPAGRLLQEGLAAGDGNRRAGYVA